MFLQSLEEAIASEADFHRYDHPAQFKVSIPDFQVQWSLTSLGRDCTEWNYQRNEGDSELMIQNLKGAEANSIFCVKILVESMRTGNKYETKDKLALILCKLATMFT